MKKLSFLLAILLLASCGKDDSSTSKGISTQIPDSLPVEGNYRAVIRPINTMASGIVSGMADIEVNDNELRINLLLDDAPKVSHVQAIHTGIECPTTADLNGDRFIDQEEALSQSGEVMLYLHDKINTTITSGSFPVGGSYTYRSLAKKKAIEMDLTSRGKSFEVSGKVILIHGANNKVSLPPTAGEHQTLPIACGIIERID